MREENIYSHSSFFKADPSSVLKEIGKDESLHILDQMLLIRNFELRAEQAYRQNKAWGFLHLYIGQEAIQTSLVSAVGKDKAIHTATYRCHALALLLGMTAKEGMCELYGKINGRH